MSSPSKIEPAGLDREALERERSRLEGLLALDEAWRALRQLEERLARGEATSAVGADALKASLERELASNRLYSVYRDVTAKLAAPAVAVGGTAPAPKVAADVAEATAFRTKVTVKPSGAPAGTAEAGGKGAPDDDLTRIRGITRPIAERLQALGVCRFETIADWTRADVDRISIALGLGRAIVRQSWVDQAAILMQTRPSRDASPVALPADAPAVPVAAAQVTPTAAKLPVEAPPAPQLPKPAAPPPQAVLGTLVQRRSDQPVNEPLLSLQRPRAALTPATAPAAAPSPAKTAGRVAAAPLAPSKPPKAAAGSEQAKPMTAAPATGPVSAAARAAAIAARQAAPAPAKAAPVSKPAAKSVTATPAAKTAPATAAPPVPPPAKALAVPAAKPNPYESRVDLIDGLNAEAIAALAKAGVTKAAQIAAFKAEDVSRWRHDLGAGLRVPLSHVIEQAAMLAGGQLPAAARRSIERQAASLVPRPLPTDWGPPLLIERLRREAEEAARPKTPEEADRIARRSLREALAGGDPGRAAFASTMTTARTRLVDRLALIDLPRKPRGSGDDVVAAFEERMAALQRDLDEMERRLRADPVPRVAEGAAPPPEPRSSAAEPAVSGLETGESGTATGAGPGAAALGSGIAAAAVARPEPEVAGPPEATTAETPKATPAPAQPTTHPSTQTPAPVAVTPAATAATSAAPRPAEATAATALPLSAPEPAAAKITSGDVDKPIATAVPVAAAPASRPVDADARELEREVPLGLGEADVVIVAKAAPQRPAESPVPGAQSPPVVSAESLAKRLRRFGAADPIEAEDYAAYHGEVEEAAVEIVRGPRPAAPPKSGGAGVALSKGPAGERNSAIKRFVRALSGGG